MVNPEEKMNQVDYKGRREFLKFLSASTVAIPPLVGMPAVNMMVDSADYFFSQNDPTLDDQLRMYHREIYNDLSGDGSHIIRRGLNRPFLWQLLVNHGLWKPENIETLFLGSSLGMTVNSKLAGNSSAPVSFINASVTSATVRDHIISFELLREKGIKPKRVILEVDAWSLVEPNGAIHKHLRFYSQEILKKFNLISKEESKKIVEKSGNSFLKQFRYAFSPSYLQHNVELISGSMKQNYLRKGNSLQNRHQRNSRRIGDLFLQDRHTIHSDLSVQWNEKISSRTEKQVRQVIRKKSGKYRNKQNETVPFWCFQASINEQRIKELEFLVELIRKSGATVELLLLPMHPYYLEYQKELAEKNNLKFTFRESLTEILKVAKKNMVLVRGRYLPKKETRYFIDNSHQTREGVRDDFNQIFWLP
jgi:hypothetical protein